MPPTLRRFQRQDVDQLKAHGLRALIASAMGTGKTIVAIRALAETHETSFPALVVCPASVTLNWAREWKKWAPGINIVLIEDGDSRIPKSHRATVYIISWALLDARWTDLLDVGIRTVVADEAHFSKSPDALRSQALYQITRQTPHVLLLSGTPLINEVGELAVLKALIGNNPLMIRRLLEDVAKDVPPKKRSYIPISLRPRHREAYDRADADFEQWLINERSSLEKQGLTEIDVERTLAAEALTKIGYLRRLVGEYKVPAAADWIARAVRVGEPVVVFCEHQNVVKKLSKTLRQQRIRHGVLDGNTSSRARQELVDDFQRYKFPVFIGTRAAKEGITLHAARNVLFIERFYTSADEEQAEDRTRRIGQLHPTTMWYLHADNTVDDRVDQIVRGKRQIIRSAIGSADTAETSAGNVVAMLRTWGEHVGGKHGPPLALGLGEPLPPLPSPRETHGIVFYGKRWQPLSALRWCKMHGYAPQTRVDLAERFKLVVHPAPVFQRGKFDIVTVGKDLKIIVGRRLSRENERQVRRTLDGRVPKSGPLR